MLEWILLLSIFLFLILGLVIFMVYFINNLFKLKKKYNYKKILVDFFNDHPEEFIFVIRKWLDSNQGQIRNYEIAQILVYIGQNNTAKILKQLSNSEVKLLIEEIAKINELMVDKHLLGQFILDLRSQGIIGKNFAKEVLIKSLGLKAAEDILNNIVITDNKRGKFFNFLKTIPSKDLAYLLEEEQPQTIALILSYLEPETSANILPKLSEAVRSEVAKRIALMGETSLEVISEIEKVIKKKLEDFNPQELEQIDGARVLADILTKIDKKEQRKILSKLDQINANLTKEVKKLFFVFEDIIYLDKTAIKVFLTKVDIKDLIIALKTASNDVQEKILCNMNERVRKTIKKELANLGPIKLYHVELAQTKISEIIQKLEETGDIEINRETLNKDYVSR